MGACKSSFSIVALSKMNAAAKSKGKFNYLANPTLANTVSMHHLKLIPVLGHVAHNILKDTIPKPTLSIFQPFIADMFTQGLSAGGAASVIAKFQSSTDALVAITSTCDDPEILRILEFMSDEKTLQTLLSNQLMEGFRCTTLSDHYDRISEWRALHDKLTETKKRESLTLTKCTLITNDMIRRGELGSCPQTESEFMPKLNTSSSFALLATEETSDSISSDSSPAPVKTRIPMDNDKAGKYVLKYQRDYGDDYLVSKLEDGTYFMNKLPSGNFVSFDKTIPNRVKAAIYSLRESSTSQSYGDASPVRPARSQDARSQDARSQDSRKARPTRPENARPPVRPIPSQVQTVPPAPPASLPPLGVGGASHNQLDSVIAALQQQTATLQRSQELQATANAQIMTSLSYMANTLTSQQQEPASDDEDDEDYDDEEIDMDNTD